MASASLTRIGNAAHNVAEDVRDGKERSRIDSNRELSIEATRALHALIKEATDGADWWGRLEVSLLVEGGEIRTIVESKQRTRKKPQQQRR